MSGEFLLRVQSAATLATGDETAAQFPYRHMQGAGAARVRVCARSNVARGRRLVVSPSLTIDCLVLVCNGFQSAVEVERAHDCSRRLVVDGKAAVVETLRVLRKSMSAVLPCTESDSSINQAHQKTPANQGCTPDCVTRQAMKHAPVRRHSPAALCDSALGCSVQGALPFAALHIAATFRHKTYMYSCMRIRTLL